jgi:uncharacterized membrane protein
MFLAVLSVVAIVAIFIALYSRDKKVKSAVQAEEVKAKSAVQAEEVKAKSAVVEEVKKL